MNLFKKPIICLAFALLVLPKAGFSQYQFEVDPFFSYFRDLKQYDLGFTSVIPFAHFEGVVPAYDAFGKYAGDTTAKRKTPGSGVGGFIGLSIPFKATGHISCWAVNLNLMFNMYSWTNLNEIYMADGTYSGVTPDLEATTLQIGLPIGIDYKIGNDAIQTKRLAFGTSLGAGVMPNYSITSLTGVDSVKSHGAFGFNPYFKADFSVFLGICMKLRLMYTMGDVTLINVTKPTDYRINGPFKVTSNGDFMISLVFMPFSGGWYERKWYSTHDTYNQHDRLN